MRGGVKYRKCRDGFAALAVNKKTLDIIDLHDGARVDLNPHVGKPVVVEADAMQFACPPAAKGNHS